MIQTAIHTERAHNYEVHPIERAGDRYEDGTALVSQDEDGNIDFVNSFGYWIRPERFNSAEECFDWLIHLQEKRWFSPEMMYDLVYFLRHNRQLWKKDTTKERV